MEYLLQNHGMSTYCCTVDTEEAETNVFVTLNVHKSLLFKKRRNVTAISVALINFSDANKQKDNYKLVLI